MVKYFLAAALVATCAFAVSPDSAKVGDLTERGTLIYSSTADSFDVRDDTIFDQWWTGSWSYGIGAMWYYPTYDMKCAGNFQIDEMYDQYQLTSFDHEVVYWYGSPNTTFGCWATLYEDGGSAPATTEPYEFASGAGWHDAFVAGDAREWDDDFTGYLGGDYWPYGTMTETADGDGCYKVSANLDESAAGGWYVQLSSDDIYWFSVQRYALYPGSGPYGGPRDYAGSSTGAPSPGWLQSGNGGAAWVPPSYSGDICLRLYGVVGIPDETDPTITDTYPLDEEYPSGVPPTDSMAGCHWQDGDPEENRGIDVGASSFFVYLGSDLILGMLDVDDTDLFDVIVDFEADDTWGDGQTYTVETETFDKAGNSATDTWDFTTGYTNIVNSSLGAIKAGFTQ
jgi:hypothetical protein